MISERTWRYDSLGRLLLGVIGTALLAKLIWTALTPLTQFLPETNRNFLNMILGTLSFQGSALIWISIFLRHENLSWSEAFGFRSSSVIRAIIFGIIAGILILPAAWMLQYFTMALMKLLNLAPESQPVVQTFQETAKEAAGVDLLRHQIIFGICVVIIAPLAEEILFRGLLYPTIKRMGYPKAALWGSSLLFAVLHANIPSVLPFVLFALVLVFLYEKTGNLLAPITAHCFFNGANFLALVQEERFRQFLEGL
jgi:membrane protease YdiL (CAAX protease family)